MLTRIYIDNLRSFVNFEWNPPRSCVLVGANGSGKSALFEVLCLVQDLLVHGKRLEDLRFRSMVTAWRRLINPTVELDVVLAGESYRYRLVGQHEHTVSIIEEELWAGNDLLYRLGPEGIELFGDTPAGTSPVKIPFRSDTSFLSALEARKRYGRILRFRDFFETMWSIKPDPRRLSEEPAHEAEWLERDLGNFTSWYRTLVQSDPDAITSLRDDLQRALEGFDQLRLPSKPGGARGLVVRFRFGAEPYEVSWADLSDGQRMLIALYAALRSFAKNARLVVLDEIENYVAPSEIQPWLREVADLVAAGDGQLLVISHHPETINYMAADAAWRMWRDPSGGHTRIARLQPDLDIGEDAYDAFKAEVADVR